MSSVLLCNFKIWMPWNRGPLNFRLFWSVLYVENIAGVTIPVQFCDSETFEFCRITACIPPLWLFPWLDASVYCEMWVLQLRNITSMCNQPAESLSKHDCVTPQTTFQSLHTIVGRLNWGGVGQRKVSWVCHMLRMHQNFCDSETLKSNELIAWILSTWILLAALICFVWFICSWKYNE